MHVYAPFLRAHMPNATIHIPNHNQGHYIIAKVSLLYIAL